MKIEHKGLHANRLHPDAGNPLEAVYAEMWAEDNGERDGRRTPILYHLVGDFSQRDAEVAATIIQWLGSHVGQSFVHEVKRKFKARRGKAVSPCQAEN